MSEPRITTPDVLDCRKYWRTYRDHKLHVAISDLDGKPVEIQITVTDQDPATQDFTYANADLIEKLFNMVLQHEDPYSPEYILDKIGEVSRRRVDLPGRLVEVFEKHLNRG